MKNAPRKLRVGLLLDDSLDRPDGVQQFVLTMGEWLRGQGHEVFYLVGNTTRSDISGIRTLSHNWHVTFNHNAMSIPLPVPYARIKHVLEELRLDVLHVQIPYHPLLAGRVIRSIDSHVAVIGTFHILPASGVSAVGTKALALIQSQTHRRFDFATSTSPAAQAFAKSHYHLESTVIPNPIDIEKFKSKASLPSSHSRTIVFLGRLVRRKGAQYLLAAINQLHVTGKLRDTKIVIGGKGELAEDLAEYTHKHQLDPYVEFAGFIDESEKAQLLKDADIAVFPAVSGESFGIVLLEAMASGAYVTLGGDNPGYRSVLGSIPESLIDPKDTNAFALALDTLLHNQTLAHSIHDKQMELVKTFDIHVIGPQFEDLYAQALKNRL